MTWSCPQCGRNFRRAGQRHACGTGDASSLLKDRPPSLSALYAKLEVTVRRFGGVEVVTRDRYALFRTTRIFADLTVMRDALRLVIHLDRRATGTQFLKVGRHGKRVSHVVLLRTGAELRPIVPLLREAFELTRKEDRSR